MVVEEEDMEAETEDMDREEEEVVVMEEDHETQAVITVEKKDISLETVINQGKRETEDVTTVEKKDIEHRTVLLEDQEEEVAVEEVEEEEEETTLMLPASNAVKLDTCLGTVINREAKPVTSVENRDIWLLTVLMLLNSLPMTSVISVGQPNTNWLNVTNTTLSPMTTPFPSQNVTSATKRDTWLGTVLRTRMEPTQREEEPVMDVEIQDTSFGTVLKPTTRVLMSDCHC